MNIEQTETPILIEQNEQTEIEQTEVDGQMELIESGIPENNQEFPHKYREFLKTIKNFREFSIIFGNSRSDQFQLKRRGGII